MFNKIKEIAQSWIIAFNPTARQKELAQQRYNICVGCKYYGEARAITGEEYCTDCSCPLDKKVFSPKTDACPQHFWLEVEEEYFKEKNTKTLL
jgi:hypothetical protein